MLNTRLIAHGPTNEVLTEENLQATYGGQLNIISKIQSFLYEQYVIIIKKIKILWQKFNDKILPSIIISIIYYIVWLFFFKFLPTVFKYLINIALNFKNSKMPI